MSIIVFRYYKSIKSIKFCVFQCLFLSYPEQWNTALCISATANTSVAPGVWILSETYSIPYFLCLVCRLTIVMMVGWSLKGYKVTLTAKEGQAKPQESIAKVRECSRGHMVSWVPLTIFHFHSSTGNTSLYSAGISFFFFFLSHKFYY